MPAELLLGGVLGAGLAALGWLGLAGRRAARRRSAALTGVATAHGLVHTAADPVWARAFDLPPLTDGRRPRARDVLHGRLDGVEVVAFDASHETTGRDSHGNAGVEVHRYAVWALRLPEALPRLRVVPQNALGRAARRLAGTGLQLESEDFGRRYAVDAADPRTATAVLTPSTMAVLLDGEPLTLGVCGDWLVAHTRGVHEPGLLVARWARLRAVRDGVPPFVWTDAAGATRQADFPTLLQSELDRPID